jgi:hypothetical protein
VPETVIFLAGDFELFPLSFSSDEPALVRDDANR